METGAIATGAAVSRRVTVTLGRFFVSFVLVVLVSLWLAQGRNALALFGVAMILLQAAFVVGALLGFIFSVPRVLARGTVGAADGTTGDGRRLLETNSNLERISDWLTTLLVGAGLTQISRVGEGMVAFRDFVTTSVAAGGPVLSVLPGIAPMILVIGAILGFLVMYLYTRVELTRLFHQTEMDNAGLSPDAQRAVAGAIKVVEAQARHDAGDTFVPFDAGTSASLIPPVSAASTTVSVEDALNVMFDLLYRPEGYKRVLALASSLANTPAVSRPDYWFYLAAAAGQQHAAASAQSGSDSADAKEARNTALDAATRSIKLDPSYRQRLWMISSPDGPDNDLATLRNDEAFVKLAGASPSPVA